MLGGERRWSARATAAVIAFYSLLAIVALGRAFDEEAAVSAGPGAGAVASAPTDYLSDAGGVDNAAGSDAGSVATRAAGAATPGIAPLHSTAADPTSHAATKGDGASVPPTGPGISDDEIKLGFYVSLPLDYSAFGGQGGSADDRAATEAVVDQVNASGGIAGRQIIPVFAEIDQTTDPSWTTHAQATCTKFTEDDRVFAAVTMASGASDGAIGCYAQHGTPLLSHIRYSYSPSELAEYDGYLHLLGRAIDSRRWGAAVVDGLASSGYFDDASLGIVAYDTPAYRYATDEVVLPRLAALGVEVVERAAVGQPDAVAGLGAMSSQLGNAILRFRAAGVDRVIFVEAGGAVTFLFMNEAESQGYRPKYGLHTLNIPEFQADDQAPAAQLDGAIGVGWVPGDDLDEAQYPPGLTGVDRCLEIFRAAGVSTGVSPASSLGYCDAIFLLKEALERAPSLDAAGLHAGIAALGDSHDSAVTLSARYVPGRHDSAAAYRLLTFDTACTCFAYTGEPKAMP